MQANPKNFTGAAWATSLFGAHSPSKVYAATVSFTPGARTHWHVHAVGQSLLVTEGFGYTQEWGKEIVALYPGMWYGVRRVSSIGTARVQRFL